MYHLRVRVPDGLKARVGMLEVRRSLNVYDPRAARLLALRYSARVFEVFEMAINQSLTTAQIQSLIVDAFHDLRKPADRGLTFTSEQYDLEIAEQTELALECVDALTAEIDSGALGDHLRRRTMRWAQAKGISFANLDEPTQLTLISGFARAVREQQKLFMFRLSDRIAPYLPNDPIFRDGAIAVPNTALSPAPNGTWSRVTCPRPQFHAST
ncbi:hypothetical protein BH10PSE3_BH10PSE3_07630 [soil metagenome]